MRYLFLVILSVVAIISCSNETEPENEYEKFLSELTRVPVQDSLRIQAARTPAHTPIRIVTDDRGRAIIANGINWTLHLMDDEGTFLAQTGGAGRGPNEYTAINQIHFGVDNQLYVYDARSRDITSYAVVNNEFQLRKELALPVYKNRLFLETIHKQDQGYVGVFKPLGAADYTFKVYRLDEDLQLQNLLFEMPGNETYNLRGSTRENFLGLITIWEIEGDRFYYTHSDSLSVTSVNLQSGASTRFEVPDVPKPVKGKEEIEALERQFSLTIQSNPKMEEIIREGQYLQSFRDFVTGPDYFYYELRRPGKTNGTILRINKTTEEIERIVVPAYFYIHTVYENTLFGVDITDGKRDLMILKL